MSRTIVTLTGPGGILVSHGAVHLQFDAGDTGIDAPELSAVFLTRDHRGHLSGLVDLVLARGLGPDVPTLPIVAPYGAHARLPEHRLDPWSDVAKVRVIGFEPEPEPVFVWLAPEVVVSAVAVGDAPVSVAYRVDTPEGAVVIGDDVPSPTGGGSLRVPARIHRRNGSGQPNPGGTR